MFGRFSQFFEMVENFVGTFTFEFTWFVTHTLITIILWHIQKEQNIIIFDKVEPDSVATS